MARATYDKRIFSPALLLRDLRFLIPRVPALAGAIRNPDIGRDFTEKIMIVVTAVNGCTYCTWFHAKQAVSSGMTDDAIRDMFNLQFESSASAYEIPALLFAQHYAETNRNPDHEMTARLKTCYGEKTAHDIMLLIRIIFFGNLLGNTFAAFPNRLKGRQSEKGNALFELAFFLATFWFMLPAQWLLRKQRFGDAMPTS